MAAERKVNSIAPEANALEQALRAAGLDPDSSLSFPYWNAFVNRGLRVALAELQKGTTTMRSFQGVESDELVRARERFNRAMSPAAREQVAAAENLVRAAKATTTTTTTHSAGHRSAAEIQASTERRMAEMQATIARLDAQLASHKAVEKPLALATIERLASERAKRDGVTVEQAYSLVLNEQPALYDTYNAELAAGEYAPAPAPAPAAPKLTPAQATIERLAAERAKRDGVTVEQAYVKVLAERPELYSAYVNEVTP